MVEWLNRDEYYQKPEEVVVTVFAKGIPANNVAVEFGEQMVCGSSRHISFVQEIDIAFVYPL